MIKNEPLPPPEVLIPCSIAVKTLIPSFDFFEREISGLLEGDSLRVAIVLEYWLSAAPRLHPIPTIWLVPREDKDVQETMIEAAGAIERMVLGEK